MNCAFEFEFEHDIIVQMPPKKEWFMRVKVKSVEKAIPRVDLK